MSIKYDLSGIPASVRSQILASPKLVRLFSKFPSKLLGVDNNAKTIKGAKQGFATAILYLTPADGSGVQLCPMAKIAKCDVACLATAGRGAMSNVQMARLRKTLYFLQYQEQFLAQLHKEISRLSAKYGDRLLVRLNGTSDIRWENYGVIQAFPGVQFYDYTKIPNRRDIPSNYDHTFSYSGVEEFQPIVQKAKFKGMRIAVVFSHQERIPQYFEGMACVDGDNTDIRHLDPQGVVVALYAKGKAKADDTGFVVHV